MFDASRDEITDGPISRVLLVLAAPLVLQNAVYVIQEFADTFWLGRLGGDAVAAVGLNFPIIALTTGMLVAPRIGGQVLAAQCFGDEDDAGARRVIFHALVLGGLFGLALLALLVPSADWVVSLLDPGAAVEPLAATYLATFVLGSPISGVGNAIESGFIAAGDTRAPLYANVVAVAVNVVVDPILIFGVGPVPEMGVQGAALATVCAVITSFLVIVGLALGPRETFSLGPQDVGFRTAQFYEILDVGLPSSVQRIAAQSVRVVIVGLVAIIGGAAGIAGYTVGARVATLAFVPAMGLQEAAQSMVGQNLGADEPRRATRTTWVGVGLAVVGLGALGAIQLLFPTAIAEALVPAVSGRGFELSVEYLRILSYGYWGIGATYLLLAGFNAARRTRTSLVIDLVKYWGIRLPVAILALPATATVSVLGMELAPGIDLGMTAIFWGVTGSNVVIAIGVGAYYHYATRNGMNERAAEVATGSSMD